MDFQSVVSCNLIGIILASMLIGAVRTKSMFRNKENSLYYSMVIVTLLGCVFEMVSFLVNGKTFSGARIVNVLCNSYSFLSNIIYPEIWLLFVEWRLYKSEERFKAAVIYASVPVVVLGMLLLGNIYGNYFFRIGADNLLVRTDFCWVILAFPYVYMIVSLILVAQYKKTNRCRFFPIYFFVFPVALAGILQAINADLSVEWCGIAIALVAVFLSKQKETSYVDQLSNIYNRKYMSIMLEDCQAKKNYCAGIMIDIDKFKSINDTFGHQVGDMAITDAGQVILNSIPKNAIATRYAGDEFVVILQTKEINEISEVINKIRENLKKYNENKKHGFGLSFSIGYSIYIPEENTIDQFLREMDNDMYIEKKQKKHWGWSSAV